MELEPKTVRELFSSITSENHSKRNEDTPTNQHHYPVSIFLRVVETSSVSRSVIQIKDIRSLSVTSMICKGVSGVVSGHKDNYIRGISDLVVTRKQVSSEKDCCCSIKKFNRANRDSE